MTTVKIAILHQDLEYAEKALKMLLEIEYKVKVRMFDVRFTRMQGILAFKPTLVLNRVYASVANRCYEDTQKAVALLRELEKYAIVTINSAATSIFDYDKFKSSGALKKHNVRTPDSIIIGSNDHEIADFIQKHKFPLIIKRNTGGRGKDVVRIRSKDELTKQINNLTRKARKEDYHGVFILQEFIKSNRDYDCRISIIEGRRVFAYARSLVSLENEEKWLASVSKGSKTLTYAPGREEIELAVRSTEAINAKLNEVDVTLTDNGPVIIENNPTPNYDETESTRIKKVAELLMSETAN